jgi:peptide/nickel transport system ATP-binding protein
MLEARGLTLSLPDFTRRRPFGPAPRVDILKGIDLDLAPGDSVGLVGESGSGKTSLGRTLVRLYEPSGGSLRFEGRDIAHAAESELRALRPRFQIVFQDPQSSLNPRRRIGDLVAAPLRAYGRVDGRRAAWRRAAALLERVGLDPSLAARFPHELSGGQRQRVGIARAIALDPAFVVADEIVSGLDVSSQAQILALLRELRTDLGLALILISHDLSVVRTVCDRVMVMLDGQVIEHGPCADIFERPAHAYTATLLDAIPLPDVDPGWIERTRLEEFSSATTQEGETKSMQIKGCVALLTGANGGIGTEMLRQLKARGARKIYAAVRDPKCLTGDATVEVIELDITRPDQVEAAAKRCRDIDLLINNAGVNFNTALVGRPDPANARAEMEVNYFGTLGMIKAFAPILKAKGGGTIVNMLSITGRVHLPTMGSLSVSKAAAISMTAGARAELAVQGTTVIGVMPGAVDTKMTADYKGPKEAVPGIVTEILDAVEAGAEDVYPGEMAKQVIAAFKADMKAIEKQFASYLPE